jgi:thiol-disulfide isomerase/thioredoxin
MRRFLRIACVFALALVALPAAAAEFRDFDAKSLARLKQDHAGKPFVLALWSIHCEPCLRELPQWTALQQRHPGVRIVLVATDPRKQRAALTRALERYSVSGVELWAFADDYEERVRFSIDPRWRGELPRTYLFDAMHRAEARSGADVDWIEGWMAKQAASR